MNTMSIHLNRTSPNKNKTKQQQQHQEKIHTKNTQLEEMTQQNKPMMNKNKRHHLFNSVDGQYGAWSVYSTCSASCGIGLKTRTRKCSDPAHGGAYCVDNNLEAALCQVTPCPKPTPGKLSGQTLPETNAR